MIRLFQTSTLALLAITVAACSSAQKTEAPAAPAAAAAPTPAPTPEAPKEDKVTCTKGKEVRTLVIEAVQPKGCALQYTKGGKTSKAASSSVGPAHCNDVRTKIKSGLEKSGYACH